MPLFQWLAAAPPQQPNPMQAQFPDLPFWQEQAPVPRWQSILGAGLAGLAAGAGAKNPAQGLASGFLTAQELQANADQRRQQGLANDIQLYSALDEMQARKDAVAAAAQSRDALMRAIGMDGMEGLPMMADAAPTGGPLAAGAPPVGTMPAGMPMGDMGADPLAGVPMMPAGRDLSQLPDNVRQAAALAMSRGDTDGAWKIVEGWLMEDGEAQKLPADVQEYEYARAQGYQGTFFDYQNDLRRSGATNIDFSPVITADAGNDKQADTIGTYYGDVNKVIFDAGRAAANEISDLNRLESLLSQVETGKFTGALVDFKSALKSAGIEPEQFGWSDDVAPAQAARTVINQMALELRNPAGGAGMPGAMSDADRVFLMQSVASLENTPEGNALIIDWARKVQQRNIDIMRFAAEYKAQNNGFLDAEFDIALADWAAKNPLFSEEDKAKAAKVMGGGGGGAGTQWIWQNGELVPAQ